ncbi:MAG: alpha/beta fold hydrolase, partial [Bradymonadaceae bacterium]
MSPPSDNLYIRHHGTGDQTVVGIHGWNGSYRTFDPLVPHLAEDASLYAIDLPGYGQSAPPAPFTIDAIAGCVAGALDDALSDEDEIDRELQSGRTDREVDA